MKKYIVWIQECSGGPTRYDGCTEVSTYHTLGVLSFRDEEGKLHTTNMPFHYRESR